MAKRVVWTNTARIARQQILQYWANRNKSKEYSKKISLLLRKKVNLLKNQSYIGKPSDFNGVRATLISHFSLFYKVTDQQIIIVGLWDNRRNPDDLKENLEL